MGTLIGCGHTVTVHLISCFLTNKSGVIIAGALMLSRKNVPKVVKEEETKAGELFVVWHHGVHTNYLHVYRSHFHTLCWLSPTSCTVSEAST